MWIDTFSGGFCRHSAGKRHITRQRLIELLDQPAEVARAPAPSAPLKTIFELEIEHAKRRNLQEEHSK